MLLQSDGKIIAAGCNEEKQCDTKILKKARAVAASEGRDIPSFFFEILEEIKLTRETVMKRIRTWLGMPCHEWQKHKTQAVVSTLGGMLPHINVLEYHAQLVGFEWKYTLQGMSQPHLI